MYGRGKKQMRQKSTRVGSKVRTDLRCQKRDPGARFNIMDAEKFAELYQTPPLQILTE